MNRRRKSIRLKKSLIHPEFLNLDRDCAYLELVKDLSASVTMEEPKVDGKVSPTSGSDLSSTASAASMDSPSSSSVTSISLSTPPPAQLFSRKNSQRRTDDLCETLQNHLFIQSVIPEERPNSLARHSSQSSLSSNSLSVTSANRTKHPEQVHLDKLSQNLKEIDDFITVTEEILKRDRQRDEEFYAREKQRKLRQQLSLPRNSARKSSSLRRKFSMIERTKRSDVNNEVVPHPKLRQTKSTDDTLPLANNLNPSHTQFSGLQSRLNFQNGRVECADPELRDRNCVQKTHELVRHIIEQERIMPLVQPEHVDRVLLSATRNLRRGSMSVTTEDFEMTNVCISEDQQELCDGTGLPIEEPSINFKEIEPALCDREGVIDVEAPALRSPPPLSPPPQNASRASQNNISNNNDMEMQDLQVATIHDQQEDEFVRERIQHLVHRFADRARKMRNRIEMPPTPSSGPSSPPSPQNAPLKAGAAAAHMQKSQSGFALLQHKLKLHQNTPTHHQLHNSHSQLSTRTDSKRSIEEAPPSTTTTKSKCMSTHWMCPTFCGGGRSTDVLDPQGRFYISWLFLVTMSFVYNAYVIPFRASFPFQTPENTPVWLAMDYCCDLIYLLDIVFVKHRLIYLYDGFWVKDKAMTRQNYIRKLQFKMDVISLLPLDIFYLYLGTGAVYLRVPRLLKIQSFWEFFKLLDRVLSSPHIVRVAKTLTYMLFMIHTTACVYYFYSIKRGLGTNRWVFSGKGHPYVRCFAFATKTATSIGKNPKPEFEGELVFMTFAWLMGVFVFALLIGQIRDIIATATRSQSEYKQLVDATLEFMRRLSLPTDIQRRVKMWYTFTWEQQRTLDETHILDSLPANLKTDIAISVHIQTLSKVQLFADCEEALLRELVLKLRSVTFLPGDYVCRKGEVGKEMYIVKLGQVQVMGVNHEVLATLSEGSVFGEISLLNINGPEGNRRTADVRSKGFSNLFVLSKSDLNEAIVYYPNAQMVLKKRARSLMRRNAAREAQRSAASGEESDGVIIENPKIPPKSPPPKLLDAVLKALPEKSAAAVLLTRGSKRKKRTPDPNLPPWSEYKESAINGGLKTLSCDLLLSIQNELDRSKSSNLTDSEKEQMIHESVTCDIADITNGKVDIERGFSHNDKENEDEDEEEELTKEEISSTCDVIVHREMQQ